MTLPVAVSEIEAALKRPLPGWSSQKQMAPENRRTDISRMMLMREDHRQSSVLVLLYPNEDQHLHFVLIRRPEYDGVHSGQIALPGGGREGDEDLQTTALRETYEEIGVPAPQIVLLGALSPLYIPPSNYMVYPHVGYCAARPNYRPSPREVAEIIEPPLALLLDERLRRDEYRHFPQVGRARVPYYEIEGHKVWGATAMMLAEFAAIIRPYWQPQFREEAS